MFAKNSKILSKLCLDTEFLRNVYTIFIFEKLLSCEALVIGKVAAINNTVECVTALRMAS